MSDLKLRVHLRDGSTREVVRTVPDRIQGGADQLAAAHAVEQMGREGLWTEERWFIPPYAIDGIEFISGPIPQKPERDASYYDPDTWASSGRR